MIILKIFTTWLFLYTILAFAFIMLDKYVVAPKEDEEEEELDKLDYDWTPG